MKEKTVFKAKLTTAVFSLVIALILVAIGTFAWLTVSTKPTVEGIGVSVASNDISWPFDISIDYDTLQNNANWEKEVTLGLPDALLRPTTTYDMLYWFTAAYDEEGNVSDFRLLNKYDGDGFPDTKDFSGFANIPVSNGDIDGGKLEEAQNYIVYEDFWIKSRQTEETSKDSSGNDIVYELRFNNPLEQNGEISVDGDEVNFGTYAVVTPTRDASSGNWSFDNYSGMACLRVGFEVSRVSQSNFQDEENTTRRYIYEPNATLHFTESEGLYDYSHGGISLGNNGNTGDEENKDNTVYIKGSSNGKVSEYDIPDSAYTEAWVPKVKTNTLRPYHVEYNLTKSRIDYLQTETMWDTTKFNVHRDESQEVTSLDLKNIGSFFEIRRNAIHLLSAPYSELTPLATIGYGEVYHIRVYFWLEGQDVDCWNNVAGGKLQAHFEFRGDAKVQEAS